MSARENGVYRFADCELDTLEHRLLVHGRPVPLTPKVFDTLALLVARAGHVVGKDELMATLWPRGFVHESNLTKHIWLIRRALGDDGDDARCIETVPKLGYRFVAAVEQITPVDATGATRGRLAVPILDTRDAAPATLPANGGEPRPAPGAAVPANDPVGGLPSAGRASPAPVRSATHARVPRYLWLGIAGLTLLLGAGFGWHRAHVAATAARAPTDAGAVALLGFNNLSGDPRDAWLAPALEQMLATEIAASGKLHAVSEELVRPARATLPAADAGGYAPASLATLRQRLGAHYIVSGAYLVSGDPEARQLRVDLTVQDAQTGTSVATFAHAAAIKDLPALVATIGGDLRGRFGASTDAATLSEIAAAQPQSAELARHMGLALQAFGQNDPARARDELLLAIAQAPGYAPGYLNLSRAWSMLGYRAKAIAAAKQAAQDMARLPREQQLLIRSQQAALAGDRRQQVELARALFDLHPTDPEARLRWINALIDGAQFGQALAALRVAEALPALHGDPRLAFAAANLETAHGNRQGAITRLRTALQQARLRDQPGLIAEAELQLGIALDQDAQAEPLLRAAVADYHRLANPHGEGHAWQNLANLQAARNQVAAARASYQHAMSIYQSVGDRGGEAAIYENLSRMLWDAGDRDGTEAALRQALALARETDDLSAQAWSLTGLATVLADASASANAASMYREAVALDRASGASGHLAFALAQYADLLRMRGQLDQARDTCQQAQSAAAAVADKAQSTAADFECAQVALDRGEIDVAAQSLRAMEKTADAAKDDFTLANTRMLLGQIALGRRQWSSAQDLLRASTQAWAKQQEIPGEATGSALLALCADGMRDAAARDRLAAHARSLRSGVTAHAEVFGLDVSLASLQAEAGDTTRALAALNALRDDAGKRQWIGLAFEARLAALEVLVRHGDAAAAAAARAVLVADARRAGYGWIVQRATAIP